MRNQLSFTVQERIVLHLDKYNTFREHFLIPEPITQGGIAKAIGIARNHVPRAIGDLKQDKFVEEKKARVKGSDRKKKVYFLTAKGLENAKALIKQQEIISSSLFDIPQTPNFVGRDEEIKSLEKYLASGKRVIFITGDKGIGKTSLVSKVAGNLAENKNVFWHSIMETDTLRSFLRYLSEFLSRGESRLLSYHLASTMRQLPGNVKEILKDVLNNIILIIDDVEYAQDDVKEFLLDMCERVSEFEKVQLIIIGQMETASKFKRSATIELSGLDKRSVSKLLRQKGFKDSEEIFELTQAHPLFLKILQSESSSNSLQSYLENELWESLSETERTGMQLLSLHTQPVQQDLVFLESGVDYQDITNLVRKGMIQEFDNQMFDSHSILKEFFYSTIPAGKRKRMHTKIAKKLMKQEDPANWVDAHLHLLKAGNQKDCAQAIVEKGLKLIKRGFREDVEDIISKFDEGDIEEAMWAELLLLRGYLWKLKGNWENALEDYGTALEIYEKNALKEKQADTLAKMGRVYLERGKFEKAMDEFDKALTLLEGKASAITARIFDEIGTIQARKGEVDEAEKSINQASTIAEKISDEELIARINNTRGNLYLAKEQWKDAEKSYEKSLEALKDSDELMAIIIINNLAIANYKMGDISKGLNYWEEAAERAEKAKSLNVMLTFSNLGFINYTIGDWERAIHYCNKALEISEAVGKDVITVASRSVLGHISLHRGNKDWLENYDMALSMREKLGDKSGIASSHNDLALAHLVDGDVTEASSHAEKAREISEGAGIKEQIIRSHLYLAKIATINRNTKESKEYLKTALAKAKETDNKPLQGHVYRDIGFVSAIEGEDFVAERYLKESVEILEKENTPLELGQSLYGYGRIIKESKMGDPEEYWQRSKEIFQSLGLLEVPPVVKVFV